MRSIKACLSHKSDHWRTPVFIYSQVLAKGMFDPCPFHSTFDGLSIDWKELNFVNPPYSDLRRWIEKSIEQAEKGNKSILLIPARTDTKAFKLLYEYGSIFVFITGRLRFNEADYAPFPSMLVIPHGGGVKNNRFSLVKREDIRL